MTVRIVTDSTADLPEAIVKQLGVTVVPQCVRFGDRTYRDGIDISRDEFYHLLLQEDVHPSTSQPSPQEFLDIYRRVAADAPDGILSLHLSHKLSGTYDSAVQGLALAGLKVPMQIVDTHSVSMGLGILVMLAVRLANDGLPLPELAAEIRKQSDNIRLLGFFDTLKYLAAGGRIGKARALLGSILSVKPVVSVRDGELQPSGQVRSRARGIDRLFDFAHGLPIEDLAVVHTTTPADAELLANRLSDHFPRERIIISQLSAAVGAHAGPGTLFIGLRIKEKTPG